MTKAKKLSRTKNHQFAPTDVALAELLRALAHPARLSILRTLIARGECVCGEIVKVMPLAQSTVSQHLKQLRDSGLVQGEIEGARSCYCVNKEVLKNCRELVQRLFQDIGE